jgi:uncharacterized protein YkwD
LDGSDSYDQDGDNLSYFWSQTQGPSVTLNETTNSSLIFIAPEVSEATQLSFQLIVSDGRLSDSASFSLQISPLVDVTPPSITYRIPEANQSDATTDTEIKVTFSEALLASSVDTSSLTLTSNNTKLPGHIKYDDTSHSIIFTPGSALAENTRFRVTLGETIQDLAGNRASAASWEFTTASTDTGDTPPDDNDTSGYNLGPTTQETIDACMDKADKEMLTLINNARNQARSCGGTSYSAAPALEWHCQLEKAAEGHSTSMAENNFFSHTGLDGSSPGDRITAAGYHWRTYGENIAYGYTDAQSVMDGWLLSAGHCANIMNSNFTGVGVGSATANHGSYDIIYWTQNFAAPY